MVSLRDAGLEDDVFGKSVGSHTVTAQSGAFGSKNIARGKSWTYVPRKAGVFPYTCTSHPTILVDRYDNVSGPHAEGLRLETVSRPFPRCA